MPLITLTPDAPLTASGELLLALPIDTPEQRFLGYRVEGAPFRETMAASSPQRLLVLEVAAGMLPEVTFEIAESPGVFPDWIFVPTGAPHETPSAELIALMGEIAPATLARPARVEAVVRHVEARFTYGVREIGLGDDTETMPALACDIHKGTCVDTHSYAVAAMRAAGIPAAYISGLYFPEGETASKPGHCWFAVRAEGAPHHWDISHFLKYDLGPVRPVMNPRPGFRYAMAVGRDVKVEGAEGAVTFTRLSGFNWLSGPETGEKLVTLAEVSGRESVSAAA